MVKGKDPDVSSQRSHRSTSSLASVASASKKAATRVGRKAVGAIRAAARPLKRLRKGQTQATSDVDTIEIPSDDDSNQSQSVSEDDEAKLERLKATWTSPAYSFFKDAVELKYDENKRPYQWFPCAAVPCKGQGGVKRYQDTKDFNGTGNLMAHARRCFGADVVDAASSGSVKDGQSGDIRAAIARMTGAPDQPQPSTRPLSAKKLRVAIVRWVTEACRPIALVMDRMFVVLMRSGRLYTEVPSPRTVSRDIEACFKACRKRIDQILKDHPGMVHITTDAWTSPNHRAFVAFVAHLSSEGKILTFLLDIIEVPRSHTGAALAQAFQAMLVEHGLEEKVMGITCDNATANDVQIRALAKLKNSFVAKNRIRCYNHTLNLAVKALLKPFSGPKKKKKKAASSDKDDDTTDAAAASTTTHSEDDFPEDSLPATLDLDFDEDSASEDAKSDSYDIFEDRSDEDSEEDVAEAVDAPPVVQAADRFREIAMGRDTVLKLRELAFKIINSPTIILPGWKEACKKAGLRPRMIPRPVDTRWNSTYDMLHIAYKYRPAVDAVTADRSLKLRAQELSDEHWKIVVDLLDVLEIFKKQTLLFSHDNSPTITNVLPAMRQISNMLSARDAKKGPLHPSVRLALEDAIAVMTRYQSYTADSDIYRVSMTLHPLWKTALRQIGWSQDMMDEARSATRRIFAAYKAAGRTWSGEQASTAASRAGTPASSTASLTDNFDFMALDGLDVEEQDELDIFFSLPPEKVDDPVLWWWNHRQAYPVLSLVAMDYMSVPATSTAVERVFSHGRRLINFTRNRLTASAIRAFLCLGTWGRKNMLRDSDLLDAISPAAKRKRGQSDEDET